MFKKIRWWGLIILCLAAEIKASPNYSYYNAFDFEMETVDGKQVKFEEFRGKLMLVINLPAKCSFNVQYHELEELWQKYNDKGLVILAFTSNDFAQSRSKTNTLQTNYCNISQSFNFYISVPVDIIDKKLAHPFYQWIRERKGGKALPEDDYFKILISTDGEIIEVFPGNISALDAVLERKIIENLPAAYQNNPEVF